MIAIPVSALHLTGSAAATIDFGSSPSPLTGAFTIELWFRPDVLAGGMAVLMTEFGTGMTLRVQLDKLILSSPTGTRDIPISFYWPLQEKYWFHMAVVYETPNIRIVVEHGELPAGISMQWPQPAIANVAEWEPGELNRIRLGSFEQQGAPVASCNGAFAELRVWNLACVDGDLFIRRHERLIGNEAGLVGYWMLDEAEGSFFYDSSTNDHDGSIYDGTWERERESRLALRNGQMRQPRQPSLSAPAQLEHLEQNKLPRLNDAYALLDKTRAELDVSITALEAQKANQERELAAKAMQNTATLEAEQRKLAELRATIAKKKEEALVRQEVSRKIRLREFIERLQEDIGASRARIRDSAGRLYGLDNVEMDVKMIPGVGGRGMALPDLHTKAAPGRLSTLTLRYRARPQEEEMESAVVPQLAGYTEVFARRKLAEAGFRVEVVHQLVEESQQHGRVLTQYFDPVKDKPGESRLNNVVTLVIGQSR